MQRHQYQAVAAGGAGPEVDLSEEQKTKLRQLFDDLLAGKTTLAEQNGLDAQALETIYADGYEAWQRGDIAHATSAFRMLAMQQPLDRRFPFAYACALQRQGQWREALNFFRAAVAMEATEPYAVLHSAECLIELRETEAARHALMLVIALCRGQSDNLSYDPARVSAQDLLLHLHQ